MKRSNQTMAGLMFGAALAFAGSPALAADRSAPPSEGSGSMDKTGGTPSGGEETSPTTRRAVTRSVSQQMSVTATIENVDKKNRKLTLKDPDGDDVTVHVPKEVQGFDKLKAGEAIDITYREGLAMTLLPGGAGEAPDLQEKTVGSHDVGNGVMAREITASATVTHVDTKNNKVTVKGPNGNVNTIKVEDPDIQQRLKNVKPGDVIQLTYSEAVATSLKQHAGKAK
jgi:hypothetical protein